MMIAVLLILSVTAYSQRSIDRLFERYSGREGFTTVNISGNLLNIAASFDDDDKDVDARITGVRILAQKDDWETDINFLDMVKRDLDFNGYEEFLSVREHDQDVKMMVRLQGRRVTELLIVTGGRDNAIIQVKGDMTVSDAKRLSERMRKDRSYKDEEL